MLAIVAEAATALWGLPDRGKPSQAHAAWARALACLANGQCLAAACITRPSKPSTLWLSEGLIAQLARAYG